MTTNTMREIRLWIKDLSRIANTILLAKSVANQEKQMNNPKVIRIEDYRQNQALPNNFIDNINRKSVVEEANEILNQNWNRIQTMKEAIPVSKTEDQGKRYF